MNEKLQYATMLDIPVETSNVSLKRVKKRRVKKAKSVDPEAVKEKLVKKVNSETALRAQAQEQAQMQTETPNDAAFRENPAQDAEKLYAQAIGERTDVYGNAPTVSPENAAETETADTQAVAGSDETAETQETAGLVAAETEDVTSENQFVSSSVHKKRRLKGFKFGVIGVELAVMAVLIASIFLTNAFYEGSAINVFMKRVFAPKTETVTVKNYDEFAPVMKYGDVTKDGAVMTVSYSGAVYSSADGKVTAVEKDENGLYIMTIAHSDAFSSTIYGLKFAYLEKGDAVYGTVPVGYAEETYKMVFATDSGELTDYTVENGTVKWS